MGDGRHWTGKVEEANGDGQKNGEGGWKVEKAAILEISDASAHIFTFPQKQATHEAEKG